MNIILDTDLTNEIDDMFAMVYLLKSDLSKYVSAITLEPYDTFWQKYDNRTTMVRNNLEAHHILKLLNYDRSDIVYCGSKLFYTDVVDKNANIEAVDKIIDIASSEKTIILATGCLTNIALAITKNPNIGNNIKLIWLGGRNPYNVDAKVEFNLRQDIKSAQIVFNHISDITIIWSKEIASNIKIQKSKLTVALQGKNEISDYLLSKYLELPKIKTEKIKNLYDVTIPVYLNKPYLFKMNDLFIKEITDTGVYLTGGKRKIKYCTEMDVDKVIDEVLTVISI